MNNKGAAAVSHYDRELAVESLKAAMESLDDPENRAAGLLAVLKAVGMKLSVEAIPHAAT